jgi:hypothetical protein
MDWLKVIPVVGGLISSIVDATAGRDERDEQLRKQKEEQERAEREARKPKFRPMEVNPNLLADVRPLDTGGGAQGSGPVQYQMDAIRRMRMG